MEKNMNNKNAQNCWEFWDCKVKENCPAFITDSGKECWLVTNPLNRESACPMLVNKIAHCWECDWYKKLNPEDVKK